MNGDPSTTRDEADDFVTRQRIAALGVTNENVVDAVEFDAVTVAAGDFADERFDAALFEGRGRHGFFCAGLRRREKVDDVLRRELSVSDTDEQFVDRVNVDVLVEFAQLGLVLGQTSHADAAVMHFFFEQLAAEFE